MVTSDIRNKAPLPPGLYLIIGIVQSDDIKTFEEGDKYRRGGRKRIHEEIADNQDTDEI